MGQELASGIDDEGRRQLIVACKACGYEGEAPWDAEHDESGEWPCLQCGKRWPLLDFDRLWLARGRTIEYSGSIDLVARTWPELSNPTHISRVWRQCGEDSSPCFLHSDPEAGTGDDFYWGLRRYSTQRLPTLHLAFAILYDFYGWLSWADPEIAYLPYSQNRWAQEYAIAFLNHTIVHLPSGKPWTMNDADLQSACARSYRLRFQLRSLYFSASSSHDPANF